MVSAPIPSTSIRTKIPSFPRFLLSLPLTFPQNPLSLSSDPLQFHQTLAIAPSSLPHASLRFHRLIFHVWTSSSHPLRASAAFLWSDPAADEASPPLHVYQAAVRPSWRLPPVFVCRCSRGCQSRTWRHCRQVPCELDVSLCELDVFWDCIEFKFCWHYF